MIIVENPNACTGCSICEMACSFHHFRKYSKNKSSIKVNKSIFNKGALINIVYKKQGRPGCDFCKGEKSPLCILFCPENVLQQRSGENE